MSYYSPVRGLAAVIAQLVHFHLSDFQPKDDIPDFMTGNVSYICACFLAQHTVHGCDGVETDTARELLQVEKRMPYLRRLRLAEGAVNLLGGEK